VQTAVLCETCRFTYLRIISWLCVCFSTWFFYSAGGSYESVSFFSIFGVWSLITLNRRILAISAVSFVLQCIAWIFCRGLTNIVFIFSAWEMIFVKFTGLIDYLRENWVLDLVVFFGLRRIVETGEYCFCMNQKTLCFDIAAVVIYQGFIGVVFIFSCFFYCAYFSECI